MVRNVITAVSSGFHHPTFELYKPLFIRPVLLFVLFYVIFCFPPPVLAEDIPPNESDTSYSYTVLPGDTLAAISRKLGTTVHSLMLRNNLQSPTHIFPGQSLTAAARWHEDYGSFMQLTLSVGSTLLDLSQRAGLPWEDVAAANRILNPSVLVPGYSFVLPSSGIDTAAIQNSDGFPITISMRYHLPYWYYLKLNPYPLSTNGSAIVPADQLDIQTGNLPEPLLEVAVNAQPFVRGTTAQFSLTSSSPLTCTLLFLDQQVPCYQYTPHLEGDFKYTALLGLSPLLDPGEYMATLSFIAETGNQSDVPLSMIVTRGRYDYERIDLPADRTSLLDPVLSQKEREKIAALRTVRTADKLWSLPFSLPLTGSVTSYYGSRRSYGYGFTSFHAGTDFRAQVGVPVSAPVEGRVVLAETLVVRGNAVILDHGWGVMSGYWHLSRFDVAVGQLVERGDLIGAVGNTGLSTGPHLHWEMWVNGVAVSPLEWVDSGNLLMEN